MRDAGIPTAAPYGIVELTPVARVPARHRVLRRRAARSATPRSTTRSSTRGSRSIRKLWDSGLAHRDIKPANLLVLRRAPPAHRRRLRAGATLAVAPGRRPRQHDAGARGAHRSGARVRAGAAASSRPKRSARRSPRRAVSPAPRSCARSMKQDGRDLLAQLPRARAAATADLAPAVEPAPGRTARSLVVSVLLFSVQASAGLLTPGARPRRSTARRPAAPAT